VAESGTQGFRGLFARLLRVDPQQLAPQVVGRLQRVLRLDSRVYAEIEDDRAGMPQAFAIVIATALLAGIGQGSPVLVFLGVAWALLGWLMAAALIWGIATIVLARPIDYPRLLVGLGYAYVWTGLMLLARFPYLGALVSLASLGLCFVAFVQASERALGVPTERALAICGSALAIPFLLMFVAFR
jgi:hypothetical protein